MERRWDIRTIYLYLVSFVTLMMVLFGAVNGLQAGFDYFFQPKDLYTPPIVEKIRGVEPGADPQNLEAAAKLEQERMERQMRYSQLQRVFGSLASIGVGLPVYLYHWRKINQISG
jgi:hypothetical protein